MMKQILVLGTLKAHSEWLLVPDVLSRPASQGLDWAGERQSEGEREKPWGASRVITTLSPRCSSRDRLPWRVIKAGVRASSTAAKQLWPLWLRCTMRLHFCFGQFTARMCASWQKQLQTHRVRLRPPRHGLPTVFPPRAVDASDAFILMFYFDSALHFETINSRNRSLFSFSAHWTFWCFNLILLVPILRLATWLNQLYNPNSANKL